MVTTFTEGAGGRRRAARRRAAACGALLVLLWLALLYLRTPPHSLDNLDKEVMEVRLREMVGVGGRCEPPRLDLRRDDAIAAEPRCGAADWVVCHLSECRVTNEVLRRVPDVVCEYREGQGAARAVRGAGAYRLRDGDAARAECRGGAARLWRGAVAGLRVLPPPPRRRAPPPLSLMLVVLESVSRAALARRMPRSLAALHRIGAIELENYNVVGGEAEGALSALLAGRAGPRGASLLPLMHERGARTALFALEPLHSGQWEPQHALRALAEALGPPADGAARCVGGRPHHDLILNLTSQFHSLEGVKASVSVVGGACGAGGDPAGADAALGALLAEYGHKHRDHTVLALLGASGPRYGARRTLPAGWVEERLPAAWLAIPRAAAAAALRANCRALATPRDAHATLLHALALDSPPQGLSLLSQVPPRSCAEAGVSVHWCACATWRAMAPTDPVYSEAATVLADYIINMVHDLLTVCEQRSVKGVEQAWRLAERSASDSGRSAPRYYRLRLRMEPDDAVFEGSMQHVREGDFYIVVAEDVSRVDRESPSPWCLPKAMLTLNAACVCREPRDSTHG